jgi:hypothetical protein
MQKRDFASKKTKRSFFTETAGISDYWDEVGTVLHLLFFGCG